jgi:hypothetical protein
MSKTQKSRKGEEIPVPKRSDFLSNLKKAAMSEKSSKSGSKQK